jgi:hypothetical protein
MNILDARAEDSEATRERVLEATGREVASNGEARQRQPAP